jgi:23S rRNA (uridine2552-2'-O)-methyltransferase
VRDRKNPYKKADGYTESAKARGFPARSVFKLEEIDRRTRILRPGQRVLDLGAAPGSWSIYAGKVVGDRGAVLSIDLNEVAQNLGKNVVFVQGDALIIESTLYEEHGPFDVIVSDMAPNTSGNKDADQWRSYELAAKAIEVAAIHGRTGGHFVAKIFMSAEYEKARTRLRELYEEVRTLRPEAVRKNSVEVFLVALRKK